MSADGKSKHGRLPGLLENADPVARGNDVLRIAKSEVTVDISDSELDEICFFTGEKKKGPAIRKMVIDALMLKRRQQLAQKFLGVSQIAISMRRSCC